MRSQVLRDVRPFDAVQAGVLGALGVLISVANIQATDGAMRIDSSSWLQLPVFVASLVTVLWWRRGLGGVVVASSAMMLVHVLAFGQLVRCGAGLPLVFVVSFLCGFGPSQRRERVTALVLSVVLAAVVLVRDAAAGPDLLPVVGLLQVGLFWIGRVAAQRAAMAGELRQRNDALRVLRDERAALEVSGDRVRLSARLEVLLDQRLSLLAAAADEAAAAADPASLQALLLDLEEEGRRTLGDMRVIVGQLRGGEVALAPSPSVAHLDAMLARYVDGESRLRVCGDPRVLPASVELSAYRIVEHLVTALADEPAAPVGVTMTFTDSTLEIMVAGSVPKGSDLRGAVARARERARLHAGSLHLRVTRGRAQVLAHLPILSDV